MIRCLLCIILIAFLLGCTKEEPPFEKEYPVIETLPATDIDSTGLTLNARIIGITATDLTDYGFQLYLKLFPSSPVDTAFLNSNQVVLLQNNIFSIRLSHNLTDKLDYAFRGYAKNQKYYVIGNEVIFNGEAFLSPTYTGISHYDVLDGDTLTIYGKNLHPVFDGMRARIINLDAKITYFDSNRIELIVPYSNYIGTTRATVAIGAKALQTEPFKILGPELNSISKSEVSRGDTVILAGSNLNFKNLFKNIQFVGFSGSLLSLTNHEIQFRILNSHGTFEKVKGSVDLVVGMKHLIFENILDVAPDWIPTDKPNHYLFNKNITLDDQTYVFDGSATVYIFNHSNQIWSSKRHFCGSRECANTIPLPYTIEDHIIWIGGIKGNEINREVWLTNTDQWTSKRLKNIVTSDYILDGFSFEDQAFLITEKGFLLRYDYETENTENLGKAPYLTLDTYFTFENINYVFAQGHLFIFNSINYSWTEVPLEGIGVVRTAFSTDHNLYFLDNYEMKAIDLKTWTIKSNLSRYPDPNVGSNLISFTVGDIAYVEGLVKFYKWRIMD